MKKIILFICLISSIHNISVAQPTKFTGIFELEENMGFLRTVSGIMSSLDDIHRSKKDEASQLEAMLKRSNIRKLMRNGVECIIPFDFAGSTVSVAEKQYLKSFIMTLDSIDTSYKTRYQGNLRFQIAVLGYTDRSGTEAKNKILANSRAINAARILKNHAKDMGLKLAVVETEGRHKENPTGGSPCAKDDPRCRICKIILTEILPPGLKD